MARTFTLGTLVTRCQQRADLENSDFISTTEWKGLISTVYAELYTTIAESGLRYFEATQSISSASLTSNGDGGAYIALPSAYFGTIGVDWVQPGGQRQALTEVMMHGQERNLFAGSGSGSSAWAYTVVGANLVLYPSPPTGQTYSHIYVPQPADLSSSADGTSVDVVLPAGEDFVIWGVARLALAKEESDVSVAQMEWERARQQVQNWAQLKSVTSTRRRQVDQGPTPYDPADWYWRRG